jgi:cytochrome c6
VKIQLIITCLLLFSISYFSCNSSKTNEDLTKQDVTNLWKQNCALCHGNDGRLGVNGAKDLRLSELPLDSRVLMIKKGKGVMMGFETRLNEKEINALAEYTMTFK